MYFLFLHVYRHRDYGYFWIPILGPHLGAIIGCVLYILFVGLHWPPVYEVSGDIQLDNKGKEKNKEFTGTGLANAIERRRKRVFEEPSPMKYDTCLFFKIHKSF